MYATIYSSTFAQSTYEHGLHALFIHVYIEDACSFLEHENCLAILPLFFLNYRYSKNILSYVYLFNILKQVIFRISK